MSALPVAGRFHHTAVVVSSLQDSIEWYLRCFGGELELHLRDQGGEGIAALHRLPSARFDLAYISYGGARIELFEFHDPVAGAVSPPAANEIGASHHIAFEIDDVHAAYASLSAEGVSFSRPPLEIESGEAKGYVLAFLTDPDGNRIELIAPAAPAPGPAAPAKVIELQVSGERREEFLELVGAVVEATAAEAGAEEFALHEDAENPNAFWIYERYRDDQALAVHHDQPALQKLLSELPPLLTEKPRISSLRSL